MENNITAKDFLKDSDFPSLGNIYVREVMIKFAKLHVQRALKAVYESNEEILSEEIVMSAYDLNNIK